jgi:hypothetical protein
MSEENVEIVRSIFAPWERGDYRSSEWAHPEISFVVADGPTPGSWTGVAAMAEAWREALSAPSWRTCARWKPNISSLGAVHSNPPSRSAIKPSTETLIEQISMGFTGA